MQLISGGKNDDMTVDISLSVPVADAAVFTNLYAQVTAGSMNLVQFGQALVTANITDVVFTNFHLSDLHYSHDSNTKSTAAAGK